MTSGVRPRVLLVDDRRENLVALEATLAPLDVELVTATSGAEALRHLLAGDFAVILLDVQMPELDGFETAEYIKRRERTRDIPIIFLTAISKEEHHVFRGYQAGAVDYLFKPFDPDLLRSKVTVFADLWRAGRALRAGEALQRATFDFAPIGMARIGADGRIAAVNRALCETLDLADHELVGRTLDDITHRDDRALDTAQRDALLQGSLPGYEIEKRLVGARGRRLPALLSLSVARDGRTGVEPILLVQIQDLGERKRAERAREMLIREQAARVEAEAVNRRLEALARVTDAALAPLPLDALLGELLSRIAEVLRVDSAAMALRDDDGPGHVLVRADEGVDVPVRRTGFQPAPGGLVERVEREREPVIVEDVGRAPELGADLAEHSATSLLAVPLMLERSAIGALIVGSLFARTFSEADVSLLQVAADRAALAIERARLFEREHRIAQQLQRALLPERLPGLPGLRLAARYQPGGAGAEVGGDWYDALTLPGGRLALVIGDVAGRGVAAAATMGQLRSALRAYLLDDVGPGEVLGRLNRFELRHDAEAMATVALVEIDPVGRSVRYAVAGHPPPMVVGPGGQARMLEEGRNPPLGAVDDAVFDEAGAPLEPGSTVILYTDGIVERPGRSLDEGFADLHAAVDGAGASGAEALCDAILAGTLGGAETADDVTVVVAHSPLTLGPRVEIALAGRPDTLVDLRTTLRRWLAEQTAGQPVVAEVTMATNEAVQNAIEHAHGLGGAPFEVELERDGDDVVVSVRDHGRWHESAPGDRGRGLPLMRALMDDVRIEPQPQGTTIVMRRRLVSQLTNPDRADVR